MKKTLFTLVLLGAVSLTAQNEKYFKTMGESIGKLYQAETIADYDAIINTFARIGTAEKSQWEPYYYSALGHAFKSFQINDLADKDKSLDLALESLSKAESLSDNNAEIVALQGFVYMIKISVDPASRGPQMTGKAMGLFGRAMAIDPQNPRATLFMAQMQIGTAQFFGNKIDEPCGLVSRAVSLFESQQPASPIAPVWGKESANEYVQMCNSATK